PQGACELIALLTRDGTVLDKRSIRYGIDRTPPTVEWTTVPRPRNGLWNFTRRDGRTVLACEAEVIEPDSRITRLEIVLLKDGDPVKRQVATEKLKTGRLPLFIGKKFFPKQDGNYELKIEVTNAAGHTGQNTEKKKVTIKNPAPPSGSGDGENKKK
ncbi:MAG: hypothetical protein AB8G99_07685, partial [Planctomycetaceae bacterium]